MRRTPFACARAVHSLQSHSPQSVWISDELLSSTLDRFFRISCPHQKRHGSHVPGPLEARRRAAKRRMTLSANFYPQELPPSSFNLGALFGFRSSTQPLWRYEPPSLQKDSEPLAPSPLVSVDSSNYTSTLPTSSQPRTLGTAYSFSPNTVHKSEEQYTSSLSEQLEDGSAGSHMAEGAEQLHDSANPVTAAMIAFKERIVLSNNLSPTACRQLLATAFQQCRPESDSWVYTTTVLKHVLQLNLDPEPILAQHSAPIFQIPPIESAECLDMLECLKIAVLRYPHCASQVLRTYLKLAESASKVSRSTSDHDSTLIMLIRQLWHLAHSQGIGHNSSILALLLSVAKTCRNQLYRSSLIHILRDVTRMETFVFNLVRDTTDKPALIPRVVQILSCVPKARLSELVLNVTVGLAKVASRKVGFSKLERLQRSRVWLQLLHHIESDLATSHAGLVDQAVKSLAEYTFAVRLHAPVRMPALLNALLVKGSCESTWNHVSTSKISDLATAFNTAIEQGSALSVEAILETFISRLRMEGLPYETLVQMILMNLARHAGLQATLSFLQFVARRKLSLADPLPLYALVTQRMAALQTTKLVSEEARQREAFLIHAGPRILELLNQISSSHIDVQVDIASLRSRRQFEHILSSANCRNALPLVYRNSSTSMSRVEQVHLIHQLAHQYTSTNTLSQREAWRATYYLWRYLHEHSLPVGPLFSKAVVRVAIIRPMSENRFVSAKRLLWVCRLVASVEGEDVAKKLEATFWDWRGELIKHAKDIYVSVGGDHRDKAHVGTMKSMGLI